MQLSVHALSVVPTHVYVYLAAIFESFKTSYLLIFPLLQTQFN